MNVWVLLTLAIACEVVATLCLRGSDGFSKLAPSIAVVIGYVLAFAFLGLALGRGIDLGIAYAIWAGVGVVLVCVFGVIIFGDKLLPLTALGIGLIIAGVVVVQLSGGGGH